MSHKLLQCFLTAITYLFLIFCWTHLSAHQISAQLSYCPPQWTTPYLVYGWQKSPIGATPVSVYIATSFTDDQKTQIRSAMSKWDAASSSMCLRVHFVETTDHENSNLSIIHQQSGGTGTQVIDIDNSTHVLLKADIILDPSEFDVA